MSYEPSTCRQTIVAHGCEFYELCKLKSEKGDSKDGWLGSVISQQAQESNSHLQMAEFSREEIIENIFETNID